MTNGDSLNPTLFEHQQDYGVLTVNNLFLHHKNSTNSPTKRDITKQLVDISSEVGINMCQDSYLYRDTLNLNHLDSEIEMNEIVEYLGVGNEEYDLKNTRVTHGNNDVDKNDQEDVVCDTSNINLVDNY
ncbi:hypothetical protein ABEB36_015135 [Hypothenemus hampei]|uniref:Uncharacterized protein n=1 Tax=Hypothenemus hampei TaxID=57062 RepID=A0ABD1E2K5_HYPHA